MSPPGPPLPRLPPLHLPRLLRHLRAHRPVRAGQRGGGRPHEAPGGQQQGGPAGGDGGASGEEREGGGQPAPRCRLRGRRLGAQRGGTCAGNGGKKSHISGCVRGGREWSDDNNDSGGDNVRQVQVEDEECSHGNLLSTGRMLSLPSDNYPQALKCSPYPPIGQEAYVGYSYSGSLLVNSQLKEGRDSPALEPLTGCCSVVLLEITAEVAAIVCDWDHLCYYEEIILIIRTNRKGWFIMVNHPPVFYYYSLLLLPGCICF